MIAIGAVIVIGAAWHRHPPPRPTPPPSAEVLRADLIHTVPCTGKVTARREVEIKCKATGQIVGLPVDNGDTVHRGDLLLELDPEIEARHVHQAQIDLESASARLAQAKAQLAIAQVTEESEQVRLRNAHDSAAARAQDAEQKARRAHQLREHQLISEEEAEAAEVARLQAQNDLSDASSQLTTQRRSLALTTELRRQDQELAQAALDQARLALQDAQQRLQDTKVLAPLDGVVVNPKVQVGQLISGVGDVTGGTSVMTLADLSQIFVKASVDESQIGEVRVGQEAAATFDAFPTATFSGVVRRIAPEGQAENGNVVTFEVTIEITASNRSLLRPLMTATVDIHTGHADHVLVVPIEAIRHRKDRCYVTLRGEGSAPGGEREVTVGLSDGERQEVRSGLREHEHVLLLSDEGGKWQHQE